MRRTVPTAVMLMALVAACGGGSAAPMPDGPTKFGVVAGNHQVVTAAPVVQNRLPQDVVAQAVQLPSGQVSLRARLLDAALPAKAYAQTAVNGIPNLVVCATTPDPKHALVAEVQCANTDALGKAYFTFHADTTAGVSKAQVAASTSTGTKVTDSVSAAVKPGDPARLSIAWTTSGSGPTPISSVTVSAGSTVDLHTLLRGVWDKYGNLIAPADVSLITASSRLADTTSNYTPSFAVRVQSANGQPTAPDTTAWHTKPLAAGSYYLYLFAGGRVDSYLPVTAQ